MNNRISNRKSTLLLIISFVVPICNYVSTGIFWLVNSIGFRKLGSDYLLLIHNNMELYETVVSLIGLLSLATLVFFVMCLVSLKNKEVPLQKKLIGAGLNFGAFVFASYVVGSLY